MSLEVLASGAGIGCGCSVRKSNEAFPDQETTTPRHLPQSAVNFVQRISAFEERIGFALTNTRRLGPSALELEGDLLRRAFSFFWTAFQHFSNLGRCFAADLVAAAFKLR